MAYRTDKDNPLLVLLPDYQPSAIRSFLLTGGPGAKGSATQPWPLFFPLTAPRNFGTIAPCTSRCLARSLRLKRLPLGRGYENSRVL